VLIGTGDARFFGFEYLRRAERVRPDVLYLSASLLNVEWYRDQVRALTGVELGPPRDYSEVALAFLREGRPVALTNYESILDEVVGQFPNYPSGSTIRILTPGSPLPPLREIERENDALAGASRIAAGTPVTRSEPWTAVAVNAYALPWTALAFDYHAAGDDASAERCRARAAEYPLP
jgi:hypothetical protein